MYTTEVNASAILFKVIYASKSVFYYPLALFTLLMQYNVILAKTKSSF